MVLHLNKLMQCTAYRASKQLFSVREEPLRILALILMSACSENMWVGCAG
jgi:hypothetical protein